MDMPPNSPDLDSAREHLHEFFGKLEAHLVKQVDDLVKSGIADKRWCAVSRTHFEEGFMALHRALRDYPGDDPNDYGKVATHQPMPAGFTPDVDTRTNTDQSIPGWPEPRIEDYGADGKTR